MSTLRRRRLQRRDGATVFVVFTRIKILWIQATYALVSRSHL